MKFMTKEDCNKINNQIMEDIREIKSDVKTLSNDIGNIKIQIATLPDQLKDNFADKRIEENFDKLTWLVVSAVILALLGLILK
jgi:hypothetical protein